MTESDTRLALEQAGFTPVLWRDDTELALEWFKMMTAGTASNGLNLGIVMGPKMREMTDNLGRNLREGRLGLLSAILKRD